MTSTSESGSAKKKLHVVWRLKHFTKENWADPEWRAAMMANKRHIRKDDGFPTRSGIHLGLTWKQYKNFRRQARFEATLTMKKLEKAGILDIDTDVQAREALHTAIEIMRMPIPPKDRLAAARTVLEWTKSKPVSKQEVTVNTAEEWLEAVTADNGKADEGTDRSA